MIKGYNGTIFAYGQTSSGKTHTMSGPDGSIGEPEHRGVIPRCIAYIFEKFGEADEHIEFTVQTSFMEIYLERVKDLLNIEKSNLPILSIGEEVKRNDSVSESISKVPVEVLPTIFVGIVFERPKTRSTVLFVEYVWNADFSSRVEN